MIPNKQEDDTQYIVISISELIVDSTRKAFMPEVTSLVSSLDPAKDASSHRFTISGSAKGVRSCVVDAEMAEDGVRLMSSPESVFATLLGRAVLRGRYLGVEVMMALWERS